MSIYEDLPPGAYQEEPLKRPVASLLEKVAADVRVRFETALRELSARPDLGVKAAGLICGHIELKAPGKGANPDHPNLIYTDGSQWALFRLGERVGEPVHLRRNLLRRGAAAVICGLIAETGWANGTAPKGLFADRLPPVGRAHVCLAGPALSALQ